MDQRHTGSRADVVHRDLDIIKSYSLLDSCTVFQTEIYAIKRAADVINPNMAEVWLKVL